MRLFRRAVMAASMAVLALVAGPGAAVAAPPTGTLTIGLSGFPAEASDPILMGFVLKYYLAQVFDYLVGTDQTGKLSTDNGLARAWEASPDGKTWTFHLRNDATFDDGSPVTAEDARYSLTRALGPRSTTGYAGVLRDVIAAVDAPASDRLVITLKKPFSFLPDALSRAVSSEGMVVPKAYIEAHGDAYFDAHPIGSGPYHITERVPGSHVTLEARDRHWRVGVPRYRSIVIRLVPEETTRIAMLRQGQLDIIDVSPERVKELQNEGLQLHVKKNDALINCWWIEPWEKTPIGDRRVREALSVAINRQEIGDEIFYGTAHPAAIPLGFSWSFPEVGFEVTPDLLYKFDPERSKKLLADAGFPNGFQTTIYTAPLPGFPEARDTTEAIAGYWQNIGMDAKLVPMDFSALRKLWIDRAAPGGLICYNQANRNAFGSYSALMKFGFFNQPTGFMHDAEIAKLVTATGNAPDLKTREADLREIFRRLREETLDLPIVNVDTPYAAAKGLPHWDPGSIPYDLNLDELITQ